MSRSTPGQRLVDVTFATGWRVSRHAPEPVAQRVMDGVAERIWRSHGPGVRQLSANLGRAVPEASDLELAELTRTGLRSYFRYWQEAFRLPTWSHERIVDSVVTSNESGLRGVHAKGAGAIVVLPHTGNWDHAGAWACLTGLPVSTVAERLRPESLYRRFVAYRATLGIEVAALDHDANPVAEMRAALGRGRVVCLLADRTVGGGGVEVGLLGEPARLPGGPALLSRLSDVPIVVCVPTYRGSLLHLRLSDPIEPSRGRDGIVATTQRVADELSAGIRSAPSDWHMLQPVFVADLAEHEHRRDRADRSNASADNDPSERPDPR